MALFQIWHNNTDSKFTNTILAERTLIGTIEADSFKDAFKMAQNDWNPEYCKFGVRSTSVGDMIRDLQTGDVYIVQGLGFLKIEDDQVQPSVNEN
jgi:hypothetical protein